MKHVKQLSVLLLVWAGVGCTSAPERVAQVPKPGTPHLKVMTYNLNYGLVGDRATVEAIGAADADVVCLQETTPAWEAVIQERYGDHYPYMAFEEGPGAGGLGVLSKVPLSGSRRVEGLRGWFPAWRVVAATPLGPVQLLMVHLRPPMSDDGSMVKGYLQSDTIHHEEITTFAAALEPKMATVVLGDFNEEPGDAALAWLEQQGFANALPAYQPGAQTWRWSTSLVDL
ncbi:MAG: endonuclease/exonuclease/phosphatase family protein, partial [Myxococcota bacterium]